MKRIIFLCFSLGYCISLLAQVENSPMGGQALALANTVSTIENPMALWNNIAGIAQEKKASVFFAYDNRFSITAFQTFGLGSVFPLNKGAIGLQVSRFGDALYNEQKVGVGYAYHIGKTSLGFKTNYIERNIQDLQSQRQLILELGGIITLTPTIFLGMHIHNVYAASWKVSETERETIPVLLKMGVSYRPSPGLLLNIEVEKQIDFSPQIKMGLEYEVIQKVFLRTGINTYAWEQAFGIGFQTEKWGVDYALVTQGELGISQHISMIYKFPANI